MRSAIKCNWSRSNIVLSISLLGILTLKMGRKAIKMVVLGNSLNKIEGVALVSSVIVSSARYAIEILIEYFPVIGTVHIPVARLKPAPG